MHHQFSLAESETVFIPLAVGRGFALVDVGDAHLAKYHWRLHTEGYAIRYTEHAVDGGRRSYYLHREVLGLQRGDGLQCDHINRNRLDCRRANLRVVSNAQNCQNRLAKSGNYRGVHFATGKAKWHARVKLDYVHHHLGTYVEELDAARAAEAFRRKHTPFAVPNPTLDPLPSCVCRWCRPDKHC